MTSDEKQSQKNTKEYEPTSIQCFIQDLTRVVREFRSFSSYPLLRKGYALMLLLCVAALLPMPYEFYISLRMLICINLAVFIYTISKSNEARLGHYTYMLLGLIVLYNPLFVIHLEDKAIWAFANAGTLYLLFIIRGKIEDTEGQTENTSVFTQEKAVDNTEQIKSDSEDK